VLTLSRQEAIRALLMHHSLNSITFAARSRNAPEHEKQPKFYAYHQKKNCQLKVSNCIAIFPRGKKTKLTQKPTILIIFFYPLYKITFFMASSMNFATSEYRNMGNFGGKNTVYV